jgi:hypothetical protein
LRHTPEPTRTRPGSTTSSLTPTTSRSSCGDERHRATAEVLTDPRRAEVYATQAGRYPGFAGYQEKTLRAIPVIALTLQR